MTFAKNEASQKIVEAKAESRKIFIDMQAKLDKTKKLYQDVMDSSAVGQRYIDDLDKGTKDIEVFVLQHIKELSEKEEECSSLIEIITGGDSNIIGFSE